MAPLRSLGNIFSAFDDFYARTGKDAVTPYSLPEVKATGGTRSNYGTNTIHQLKVDGVTIKCLHFDSKKRFSALTSRLFLYLIVSTKLTSKLKSSFLILE